jgi:magnesium transporter
MTAHQEIQSTEELSADDLHAAWITLSQDERVDGFKLLPRPDAEEFFLQLPSRDEADLLVSMPPTERRSWLRLLAPDDAADVIQDVPPSERETLMELLDEPTRKEVSGLLAYAEDVAGGLMNPRFVRLRPAMSVDEAVFYLRKQVREHQETIYYAYVLGSEQRLLGVVSFRDLLTARPDQKVEDIMRRETLTVSEDMDQEAVSRVFAKHDLVAIPVVDGRGTMKGVVTVDDIVDVVQEEATEDIHKLGGMQAFEEPYLDISLRRMLKKRAGWLAALFIGEMLTATAMGHFEAEIARAVVLALFVPLIISSGGNSGSQASTLVIRAMALGEVRLKDWWRVVRREFLSGLALGLILASIGLVRILLWQVLFHTYGDHYFPIALTVALSLVGVVLWGTLMGSMLPFALRRLGFDPASASAPFIATLVDVSGILIYFTMAAIIMRGTLL